MVPGVCYWIVLLGVFPSTSLFGCKEIVLPGATVRTLRADIVVPTVIAASKRSCGVGASVSDVAQVSQPSPCAVTGGKQAIPGRPEQSNAAPVANKTSAGNSGSESCLLYTSPSPRD